MTKTYTTTITKTFDFDAMVKNWWEYSGQYLEDYNKKYDTHATFEEDLEDYYCPGGDSDWDYDEIAVIENNDQAFFNDLISCAKEKGYIKNFSEQ